MTGFDLSRHSWSLMENGPFGWIHSGVLVLSGLMVIAAAMGIGRALKLRALPVLLSVFGAGQVGAGFFIADPADGFPPGAPAGPGAFSWHGLVSLWMLMVTVPEAAPPRGGGQLNAVRNPGNGPLCCKSPAGYVS